MRKVTFFLAAVLSSFVLVSAASAAEPKPKRQKPAASSKSNSGTGTTTYKWVDEDGVTHYGDSVPPEYSQREQTVISSQGVVTGRRLAEMSPKEAAAYAAKQKEEQRQKHHDMFLVSTYPSVKEIENVRDARLDQINGQIVAAEAYISSLTTRVDGLKQRSLAYAPYNTAANARRMPDDLAEEMVRAMSELRTQNNALDAKRTELKNVRDGYDADIRRFKELRTSAAARLDEANAPKKQ
jgi:chromosome segregation ATPase